MTQMILPDEQPEPDPFTLFSRSKTVQNKGLENSWQTFHLHESKREPSCLLCSLSSDHKNFFSDHQNLYNLISRHQNPLKDHQNIYKDPIRTPHWALEHLNVALYLFTLSADDKNVFSDH